MLPEKQKMQIKANLIHTHPLYFLCRVLLDERAAQQILGSSLEKSLERGTVKSRWCSEISSLCQFLTGKATTWAKMERRMVSTSCFSCYLEGKRCTSVWGAVNASSSIGSGTKVANLQVIRWTG